MFLFFFFLNGLSFTLLIDFSPLPFFLGVRLFICLETEKELARSNSYYIERARKMVAGAPKKSAI